MLRWLLLAVTLAGCATPAERAARAEREMDELMRVYGPACERLGYKRDEDKWRDCVVNLSIRDEQRFNSRAFTTSSCFGSRGFFSCSTF